MNHMKPKKLTPAMKLAHKIHGNIINLKSAEFSALKTAEQIDIITIAVSTQIGFGILDIITDDNWGMIYDTTALNLTTDILQELNEMHPVDVDTILPLVRAFYGMRHSIAVGTLPPYQLNKAMSDLLNESQYGMFIKYHVYAWR